jgi:copper(I)-binding protein/uncharacterized protein YcnI
MHPRLPRRAAACLATAASAVLLSGAVMPVAAHISLVDPGEVDSGSTVELRFRVPHGCDGMATDELQVAFPEGVVGVQPAWLPGWTITSESVAAEPYTVHGEELTDRVARVRWSGGSLPDALYLDFTVAATILAGPGTLVFPVTQSCGDVSIAWTEVEATGNELALEHPAPTLTVVAGDASGDDGHEHGGPADIVGLHVSGGWVRPTMVPGTPTAAYLTVRNTGESDDAIVDASSPAAAVIELHQTTTAADGTMGMGPVAEVPVPAHGEAVLEPGGYHLMLIEPSAPLMVGDEVELTIVFAHADPLTVTVPVEDGVPADEMDQAEHGDG